MKIAYLITAYNQFEHLVKLVKALNDKDVVFFIHIDKKAKMPKNIWQDENIIFIDRIIVWWGGWSHQKAILNLMSHAVKYKFDYYVLLSGTDYPIRSQNFLYERLKTGGEFIDIIQGFQYHKPESRIRYYYFDCFDRKNNSSIRTKFFKAVERVQRIFFKKHSYPFPQIYHGHTWWALSHNCVSFILTFLQKNTQYIKFYKTCWCPEESLIPTIIGNSIFKNKCKGSLTYTDWTEKESSPSIIKLEHIEIFKNQLEFDSDYGKFTPVFARKFTDKSIDIIKQIDKELLH